MEEFVYKQCPNGHYYKGDYCPYCSKEKNGVSVKAGMSFTPISNSVAELKKRKMSGI